MILSSTTGVKRKKCLASRSAADAQGANCGAPERTGADRRRQPRHFIAEPEKRPEKPAFTRTKQPNWTFCPAEIVLTRMKSRLRLVGNQEKQVAVAPD